MQAFGNAPQSERASFNGAPAVRVDSAGGGGGGEMSGASGAGVSNGAGRQSYGAGSGAGAGAGAGAAGAGGGFSAAAGAAGSGPSRTPRSKRSRGESNASEDQFANGMYFEGDDGDDAQSTAAASTTSSVPVLSPPLGHHPVAPAGLIPAFLKKTYDMLETEELHKYVWWGPEGDTIVIRKTADFGNMALPRFFKHRNYGSFVRQLNIYGFRKVPCEPGYAKFKHPEFRRGNLAGIIRMKRRVPKSAKKKGAARHEVDDVIKELVALKQRQRQVEVHVDQLTQANEQLMMDNQALWQQVHDSRERQARLQARMRKLLLILLNVFQARGQGRPPMLEGTRGPSNSLVLAQPQLQLQMPGHQQRRTAASSGSSSGSMAHNTVTSTPVVSAAPTTSTGGHATYAPHLHGEAPVHHPFYRAQGHLDPAQLHSAIHFLGIHHDDPSHPVHPSTGVTHSEEASGLHPSLHQPPLSHPHAAQQPPARKRQRTAGPTSQAQTPYTVTVPDDVPATVSAAAPAQATATPSVVELQSSLANDEAAMLDKLGLFEDTLTGDFSFEELDSLLPPSMSHASSGSNGGAR